MDGETYTQCRNTKNLSDESLDWTGDLHDMCEEPVEVRGVLTAQGKQNVHALSATPTRDTEGVWSGQPGDDNTTGHLQMIGALV